MEILLHAHRGKWAVDDEFVGVIKVDAKSFCSVIVETGGWVDQALVTPE